MMNRRTIGLVAVMACLVWFLPTAASGATVHRCDGLVATIVGTDGPDIIRGTPKRDVIVGLAGNDKILGLGNHDTICGGKGRDIIAGGSGRDKIFGGSGNDRITGGSAADIINGGGGNDRLFGRGNTDVIIGGVGRDRIFGDDGVDDCIIDTDDEVLQSCETGNSRTYSGTGDSVVIPSLPNSYVVARHCHANTNRCDPYFVAEVTINGAGTYDALGIQAVNEAGAHTAVYGEPGDSYSGVFLFKERPAALEIDSGGGSWSVTFVEKSGVPVIATPQMANSGNRVVALKKPTSAVGTLSAEWSGRGNFAVVTVSTAQGRNLAVNEVSFTSEPVITETVTPPAVVLMQVISDSGNWSVDLDS
ncbi:MAG: hypothetical protein KJO18_08970 [Acidimicrobiia bacterium]|nr:hypothetical protein [Acidimicrobiia bacterium]